MSGPRHQLAQGYELAKPLDPPVAYLHFDRSPMEEKEETPTASNRTQKREPGTEGTNEPQAIGKHLDIKGRIASEFADWVRTEFEQTDQLTKTDVLQLFTVDLTQLFTTDEKQYMYREDDADKLSDTDATIPRAAMVDKNIRRRVRIVGVDGVNAKCSARLPTHLIKSQTGTQHQTELDLLKTQLEQLNARLEKSTIMNELHAIMAIQAQIDKADKSNYHHSRDSTVTNSMQRPATCAL